ncbi:hypothetical protein E2C01_054866 [Portunus trituberculatus]|uniref:Uncharacterized protein n=1 Tax=Portunus trituberculatus TaxID=210409 RepID=A0A5B7GT32_PORTR|nr:hypothetical protein [Portunus trituberculatus]
MVTVSDEEKADEGSGRYLSGHPETTGGTERASRATCSVTEDPDGFVVRARVSLLDTSTVMSTALKESEDPTLKTLSQKADRFPTSEHCQDAMMEDTHALLQIRSQITEVLIKRDGLSSELHGPGDDNRASPLTLQHYQSILYILVTVWGASGAILLLELVVHHHKCCTTVCRSMPSI